MSVRYLGVSLLLTAVGLWCVYYVYRTRETARKMTAWRDLLCYIREQISCFGTPLGQILATADALWLRTIGGEAALQEREMRTLLSNFASQGLPPAYANLLYSLSGEIGTVWRQEQLLRLDHYIAAMEKERSAFVAAMGTRVRLHLTLWSCGTLGMLLLLW